MPIDINEGKLYDFNFTELMKSPASLYNTAEFLDYLNKWKTILAYYDQKAYAEYCSFVDQCSILEYSPEYFQYTQQYVEHHPPYIFHFNIDRILKKISESRLPSKSIFVRKLAAIASFDTTISITNPSIKRDPIVLCKLYMPQYQYIVIDGNTRLNYYLMRRKLFTKYIIYEIEDKADFLLSVDWAMYSFIMEVTDFIQDRTDDQKMLENIKNSIIFQNPEMQKILAIK